ncbi:MAG: C-terminal binding protein [Haloarculaceae archaeon]|jgi:D-3-phosphoglycerate dehydrogenase
MEHTVVMSDEKTVDPRTQREILEAAGARIEVLDERTEAAVADAVRGADGLVVDSRTPVTAQVLGASETLRVVGRAGIGVDNVDLAAAAERDVTVVHVPDYCLDEVSTHALSLLLACVRNVPLQDRRTGEGTWDWREGRPLHRMRGRTLGLAGFGGIARRLASKLRAFGLEVVAYDPYVKATVMADYGVEEVGFEALLDRLDYLSIHVPLYGETREMFSTDEFERMADHAVLVNTARGPVVDEAALLDALETGEIARAGLDVLESEPPDAGNPLLAREDVVVSPHTAWYSEESRRDLSRSVASDVAAVLDGEAPTDPVDPELPWV